ncbi:hypothetical protein U27_00123 [Candidatus Vecturithrix granuli]|uniref:Uncharacterized protein n=1 Tax=Vecturithrix granuli TaxID=1499967 RepID=A0A081C6M7_VECG1|nr:hypothetical protein U27_00123 [Candidatus Vecturithrix granuli]
MASTASETKWYSSTSSTQTMRTWSEVISSFQDVPAEFQPAFPGSETTFPYTVYVPADRLSFLQKRNAMLLCLCADRLVVLEALRDRVKTAVYPWQEILYLEQGRILLYSWLKVCSRSGASTATFNTVNVHQFEPIISTIRQTTTGSQSENGQKEQSLRELAKFDYLSTLNFKFMNFGRQSIQPGDTVVNIAYQPDRCLKTFTLFHKTLFSQYATGHLTILTGKELILITESKRTKMTHEPLYGGVFTYIPLQRIQKIAFYRDAEDSPCLMNISLSDAMHIEVEFARDNPDAEALKNVAKREKCEARILVSLD